MKKSAKTHQSLWPILLLSIAFILFISTFALTACDDDDDDDDDDANIDTDDDDDEGFGCSNDEAFEECTNVCSQAFGECSDECGISPIDISDPCGFYNNSDDDDDDGEIDWSDNPEMQQYCQCMTVCHDDKKACNTECNDLCE